MAENHSTVLALLCKDGIGDELELAFIEVKDPEVVRIDISRLGSETLGNIANKVKMNKLNSRLRVWYDNGLVDIKTASGQDLIIRPLVYIIPQTHKELDDLSLSLILMAAKSMNSWVTVDIVFDVSAGVWKLDYSRKLI